MKTKKIKMISMDTSSFCTGYAIWENAVLMESGVVDLHKDKEHWYRMKVFLIGLLEKTRPDIIVIEHTTLQRKHGNVAALINLSQIIGVIEGYAIANKADFMQLYPSEWRSRIGSYPKTREECKPWSLEKVKDLFHMECLSDDESDAILIGQAYINYFNERKEIACKVPLSGSTTKKVMDL